MKNSITGKKRSAYIKKKNVGFTLYKMRKGGDVIIFVCIRKKRGVNGL